jgi:hypothetical protein
LRFSFASKTAVVDFEIRCGKNKKISWRLVPDALPEYSQKVASETSTEWCAYQKNDVAFNEVGSWNVLEGSTTKDPAGWRNHREE